MGERKRDLDWTHTPVIRGIDRMEHSGKAGTWLDRRVGAGGVALRQAGWRQFNRVGKVYRIDSPTVYSCVLFSFSLPLVVAVRVSSPRFCFFFF